MKPFQYNYGDMLEGHMTLGNDLYMYQANPGEELVRPNFNRQTSVTDLRAHPVLPKQQSFTDLMSQN